MEHVIHPSKKAPNQEKDLLKKVSITLERLLMVSDRIINSRLFVKFHKSKKLLNKQKHIMKNGECCSKRIIDGF